MKTHGMSNSREYGSWSGMMQRCYNPNNPAYAYYGNPRRERRVRHLRLGDRKRCRRLGNIQREDWGRAAGSLS
jgi:hypothetical protein